MITQLHHQNKKNRNDTIFISQMEYSNKEEKEYWKDIHEVQKRHPLPDGYEWMICQEDSKYFMMCDPTTYEEVKDL